MKEVSIIGFGSLGQQFYENLRTLNYTTQFFFDDYLHSTNHKFAKQFKDYKLDKYKDSDFYIALGYKNLKLKHEILNELILLNKKAPKFVHNTSFVNRTAEIAEAVFIYPMCNIDMNVLISLGSTINNSVVISHDAKIGKCCYISPGTVISGNVRVGDYTFIGSGTIIANDVIIGKNVKIGVGSVITKNIPDNVSVIGNPMRILDKKLNL